MYLCLYFGYQSYQNCMLQRGRQAQPCCMRAPSSVVLGTPGPCQVTAMSSKGNFGCKGALRLLYQPVCATSRLLRHEAGRSEAGEFTLKSMTWFIFIFSYWLDSESQAHVNIWWLTTCNYPSYLDRVTNYTFIPTAQTTEWVIYVLKV